jgi:hypothetical protein
MNLFNETTISKNESSSGTGNNHILCETILTWHYEEQSRVATRVSEQDWTTSLGLWTCVGQHTQMKENIERGSAQEVPPSYPPLAERGAGRCFTRSRKSFDRHHPKDIVKW